MTAEFEFDFDTWAALAKRNPEEFERRRALVVEAACAQLGGQDKPSVAWICWRIDLERERSTTPLQLCMKLSALMWNRYFDLVNVLEGNRAATSRSWPPQERIHREFEQQSSVLPFIRHE